MSFLSQEQGTDTASPIELYEIRYDAAAWYYTSGDAPFTDPSTLRMYTPIEIGRGEINKSNDFAKNNLQVTVRRDAEFLNLYRVAPPSSVVSLTIRRVHRTDTATQIVVIWKGRMLSVAWAPDVATIECESIRASVQRYGLRRQFQLQCPHVLYGAACGVPKASHEVVTTVNSINNLIVTCSDLVAYPDNHFAGGYIEWLSNEMPANERRTIVTSGATLGTLELMAAAVGLSVGQQVRVYPGCDHSLGAGGCQKFNNTPRYGGFPHTPNKSPFTGEPIY